MDLDKSLKNKAEGDTIAARGLKAAKATKPMKLGVKPRIGTYKRRKPSM